MRTTRLASALVLALAASVGAAPDGAIYDFELQALDGSAFDVAALRGHVVLVVNTASRCGLTPQYQRLQALHERYQERGLVLLGVPSNDFGQQEPGSPDEIREFCSSRFHVTFPLLSKAVVIGEGKCPLYRFLTTSNPAFQGEVQWNFAKFLVDREGHVIGRFDPRVDPLDARVTQAIDAALAR